MPTNVRGAYYVEVRDINTGETRVVADCDTEDQVRHAYRIAVLRAAPYEIVRRYWNLGNGYGRVDESNAGNVVAMPERSIPGVPSWLPFHLRVILLSLPILPTIMGLWAFGLVTGALVGAAIGRCG